MDASDFNNNLVSGVHLDHSYAKDHSPRKEDEEDKIIGIDDCDEIQSEFGGHDDCDENQSELGSHVDTIKQSETVLDKLVSNDDDLKIGRTFNSMEELVKFVNDYMEKSTTAFVRKSCNQTQVSFILIENMN